MAGSLTSKRTCVRGKPADAYWHYGNDSTSFRSDLFRRCPDMECSLSRQRTSRILLPVGWSHHRALDRLAGKTWRLARDRRTRQGIDQFPTLDARLLNYLGNSLPYSHRIRFACDLAYFECRPRYHCLHPRKRRKVLPLSNHDSVSELATHRPSSHLIRSRGANASPARTHH